MPPTEKSGRRQTSVISVAILPLPPESKNDLLPEKDLEIITQTGRQKAGGQNVNRRSSAVRMKHKPTGLCVFINGRDQGANKRTALRVLSARVNEYHNNKSENSYNSSREAQMKGKGDKVGGRGDKVRTYNYIRGDIVDHQLGRKTKNMKAFLKGDFSVLLEGEKSSE